MEVDAAIFLPPYAYRRQKNSQKKESLLHEDVVFNMIVEMGRITFLFFLRCKYMGNNFVS